MTYDEIKDLYLDWILKLINTKDREASDYMELLLYLFETSFSYTLPMDGNRASDGVDLRYRFGSDNHISNVMIANRLDICPSSVLEVMVALALRVEEQYNAGEEVGKWFWIMIDNMGLSESSDLYFNKGRVTNIVRKFLNRDYKKNGQGGLFITYEKKDMRDIEIWYQMHSYLNEFIYNN